MSRSSFPKSVMASLALAATMLNAAAAPVQKTTASGARATSASTTKGQDSSPSTSASKDDKALEAKVNQLCEQGRASARAHKLPDAAALFKKATEVMPQNPRGWNNLARVTLLQGNPRLATQYFARSLQCDPDNICAIFFVGLKMRADGQREEGAALWQRGLGVTPKDEHDWFFRGRILVEQSKGKMAEEAIQKAVAISKGANPDYIYFLAYTHDCMHKTDQAEREYRDALKLDPQNILAWNYLGVIHMKRNNLKEAEVEFRKSLSFEPQYDTAWLNLASTLVRQGKIAETEKCFLDALKACAKDKDSVAILLSNLGEFYGDNCPGKEAKAVECFQKAIASDPHCGRAYRDMGIYYSEQKNDHAGAESYFRKAIALDPKDGLACAFVGIELIQRKDYDQGKEFLERAIKIIPRSPTPWNGLGIMAIGQGHIEEAEGYFKKSVEINPKYSTGWNNLALMLRQEGKQKPAEEAARKALALNQQDGTTWNVFGHILEMGGKKKEALEAYKKCLALKPKDAECIADLANVFSNHGDKTQAETLARQAVKMDPKYGPGWQVLSDILMARGAKAEAKVALNHAIELGVNPSDMYKLGYSLEVMGDKKAARQAYTRGLEMQPEEADIILNLQDDETKPAANVRKSPAHK